MDLRSQNTHYSILMLLIAWKGLYINLKIRLGRNSFKKKIEAGNFIKDMFSKNLRSDGFCEWFANELGFDNEIKFRDYLEFPEKEIVQCRRSNSLSKTICKNVMSSGNQIQQ